jgi:Flp pilus assembly protein TadB
MRAFVGWLMAFCLGSFAYALPIDNNTTQNTNKSQIIKSNTTQTNNKALRKAHKTRSQNKTQSGCLA